jgi:hypothetical protein
VAAAGELAERLPHLGVVFGGEEFGYGLADDLVGGVAEEVCRAGVPGGDDAVRGGADDGVVRRLDEGG